MPLQTVDQVVSALDTIVQQSYDTSSRLGYFAALYRRVTCAVRDGISNGRFSDGPLIEKLDVVFASRYLDALAAFQAGGAATRSWMLAFHGCDDAGLLILQQLLAGINAHINLDLGISAAQVSPGDQLPQLKPDFDEINVVLADLVGTVETELAAVSPLIGDLEKIGMRTETSIINFSLQTSRDAAWFSAQQLASEPSFLHNATIDGLDLAGSIKGGLILHPLAASAGLKVIQQAEVKDVRRVIEVLAQGNVAPATRAVGAN
jgi:Family of unknown function (DUF5995)